MNNQEVNSLIHKCKNELKIVSKHIRKASLSIINRHITLYALIESHGTIELSIKTLFFNNFSKGGSKQLEKYLTENIKNRPFDIRYNNICNFLKRFIDDKWLDKFKKKINSKKHGNRIKSSLKTLHDTRNEFAHGGNPVISFNEIRQCFKDSIQLISVLDILTK